MAPTCYICYFKEGKDLKHAMQDLGEMGLDNLATIIFDSISCIVRKANGNNNIP